MFDDLDPNEFEDTANAVIENCEQSADAHARGILLAGAGLLGVIAPEAVEGLGLPMRFAVPIVHAAGAGLLAYPLIETMLLSKALASIDENLAGKICVGKVLATIAWSGTTDSNVVDNIPMGMAADHVLIFRPEGGAVLAAVNNDVRPVETDSFDIDIPTAKIHIANTIEGVEIDAEIVQELRNDAKLLRAAFIHGSASKCLTLATEHAQDRSQFGQPLSAYQVLRHRLSRDALAVETMKNSISRALSDEENTDQMARETAWIGATQLGVAVAESAIQVFGGMGFTWEIPLHRHLRQMRAQSVYGSAAEGLDALGEMLLSGPTNLWYKEISIDV